MRRERHNFFICWLFHLTPPRAAHFADPQLVSPRRDKESNCFLYIQISTSCSEYKSQLTAYFSNPQNPHRFREWCLSRPRSHFISGVLIMTSDCHIRPARVNTGAQCVHLTNPCTKRKVLSLTKPKGKIYKSESLRNNITIVVAASVPNTSEKDWRD